MARVTPVVWFMAVVAGALAALAVTWVGGFIGDLLERAFQVTLRAWKFAAIAVSFVNTPAGAVAGLLGALSRRWLRGLGIGIALHAVVFLIFVLTSDSISAAPAGVIGWVFTVGIIGGGLAGAIGGCLASIRERKAFQTD